MKKKLVLSIVFIVLVTILIYPLVSVAHIPDDQTKYSDTIAPGASYEWEVKTFESSGDYFGATPVTSARVGETLLKEGDIIKAEVTKDPDEVENYTVSWCNIYLNGENASDSMYGVFLGWFYFDFYWDYIVLFYPVTFTNDTGTYSLFDELYNQYIAEEYDFGYITISFDISQDTFTHTVYSYIEEYETSPTDGEEYWILETTIETLIDIENGLLKETRLWSDWDVQVIDNSTVFQEEGYVHFLVQLKGSDDISIPFNWVYGGLGLSVLAVIIIKIRKRKQK